MTKNKIHQDLLRAIKKKPDSTVRELADATGLSGPSHADYHLKSLLLKGVIEKVNEWRILKQLD